MIIQISNFDIIGGTNMSIVNERQSIRKFTDKVVDRKTLLKLVESAMLAPSSKNKKPWEFLVIDNKEVIEELSMVHLSWKILEDVSNVIIVCGNLNDDEREKHLVMTCSAATQNILIRCVELGLGSAWLGLYPDTIRSEYIVSKFNLEDNIIPISLIILGYYDDVKERKLNFDYSKVKYI